MALQHRTAFLVRAPHSPRNPPRHLLPVFIGWPISDARFSAAEIIPRASLSVSIKPSLNDDPSD